jgi:hypothetical protein
MLRAKAECLLGGAFTVNMLPTAFFLQHAVLSLTPSMHSANTRIPSVCVFGLHTNEGSLQFPVA